MTAIVAMVPKERRALYVVNCLAEHGDERFRKLYEFIEKAGVETARLLLGKHYRTIISLRDREATKDAFLSRLRSLTAERGLEAVDLFLQLHGEPGKVSFFDNWVSTARLKADIMHAVGPGCLRLVYNTSCYGDTHSPDLLMAGFRVAVGAQKVNANAASEYPIFCRTWSGGSAGAGGISVTEVLRRSDLPGPRQMQDQLAARYFKEVNSKKVIKGKGSLTINSKPS